ncbi:condensation domain-containing protein [Xanthomonas sp. BRIP62415]|uniref:condensation domain-containing protein n=1 Tax=Xanthomonas sp. BRIP62415 TaxID=2182390 RepID=UPI000F8EC0CF|nr:condensation domain-containing protein [Xanthomonas sp. BRIP62415]
MIRITSQDQEAVARLLAEEGLLESAPPVVRVTDAHRAPLSDYQYSLWLALNGGGARHANVPLVLKISGGTLEGAVLEQALVSIAEQHEALRCLIVVEDEVAWQVPQPLHRLRLRMERVDAGSLDARIDALVNAPLDIRTELPYRLHLLQVDAALSYLVVVTHHLVFDGWSLVLLQDELQMRYAQLLRGAALPPPSLKPRHLDFALWQASDAGQASRQKGLEHWRRLLQGARSRLHWMGVSRGQGTFAQAGGNFLSELPQPLSAKVHAFAAAHRTTVFVVMVSVYVEVLSRFCLQDDLCVGTPTSARDQLDLEKMIGYFVNTLLLRHQREPWQSFIDLLRRMDAQFRLAREHQAVPFHAVTRALEGVRGSQQPFTQAMFAYQTESSGTGLGFQSGGLAFEPYPCELNEARYDLLLTVLSKHRQLAINIEYRAHLFGIRTIAQFADAYLRLLDAAITNPSARLAELGVEAPFALQAVAPTMASLARPASAEGRQRLASLVRILAAVGIGCRSRVGLAGQPCEAQAQVLLALLDRGACCVVLDAQTVVDGGPGYAEQMGVQIIVTDGTWQAALQGVVATVLDVEHLVDAGGDAPVSKFALSQLVRVEAGPEGAAPGQIVFPAEAIIAGLSATGCLTNLAGWGSDPHAPVFDRVMVQLAQCMSADIGTPQVRVDGIPLRSDEGAGQVLHRLGFGDLDAPRRLHAEGSVDYRYLLRVPERIVDGSICHVRSGASSRFDIASAVLLDRHAGPVDAGMPGELLLGGAALAWGYAGDARRTAEHFIPDPAAPHPGARLLRTGAWASHDPDGGLRLLGHEQLRVDHQGVVFDLAEVECELLALDGVVAARAQRDDESGRGAISVSLVLDGGHTYSAVALREHLAPRLPGKALPSRFLVTAAPIRGVDMGIEPAAFQVLLAQDGTDPALERIEAILLEVWQQTLDCVVHRDDNFFELGGDSMLCLVVQSRAAKREVQFAVEDLFAHQTLAALAAHCHHGVVRNQDVGPFDLVAPEDRVHLPADAEAAYPMSRLQAGMFYHSRDASQRLYFDVVHVWLEGNANVPLLRDCLQGVLAQADTCRSTFHITGYSEPLQIVRRDRSVPIELIDAAASEDAQMQSCIEAWTQDDLARGFDMERHAPIRCAIHRFSDTRSVMSYSFHHALLDGWSEAQITVDTLSLYAQCRAGQERPVAAPRLRYREFIALERAAETSTAQRSFWQAYLQDVHCRDIPVIQGAETEDLAGALELPLCATRSAQLQALAASLKVSIKAVLLAVHCHVMAMVTGSPDVITGVPFNGRPELAGGAQALGLFLNTLPLRVRTDRCHHWRSLVAASSRSEAEMAPYRRFPLSAVIAATGEVARPKVLFNYLHFHNYDTLDETLPLQMTARTGVAVNSLSYVVNFWTDPGEKRIYGMLSVPAQEREHGRQIAALFEHCIASIADSPNSVLPEPPPGYAAYRDTARTAGISNGDGGSGGESAAIVDRGGAPQSPTEHVVASVWRKVLGIDDVQRNDEFNALGGDSIAAMRVVAELERIYECDIDMATILLFPRLATFCAALDRDATYGEDIITSSRLLMEAYRARLRRDAAPRSGAGA